MSRTLHGVLSPTRIEALRRSLGPAVLADLLDAFLDSLAAQGPALVRALADGDAGAVAANAQPLSGTAAELGAGPLAWGCRRLAAEPPREPMPPSLLLQLRQLLAETAWAAEQARRDLRPRPLAA
ncbi:MAG TPA: Hpt domain-containing protein [Azospirillaceae bacterium]|nr:Hpt domain-containing protein [Azospirillaceae bacterium]